MERVRRRVHVRGVVQGVGFRPFCHSLAAHFGLAGHVGNDGAGVFLELEGDAGHVAAFLQSLEREAPPLARIEEVHVESVPTQGEREFRILASEALPGEVTPVSPDVATCDDCLRELHDPADRRYRYPFINCTNCGPRYTIIRDVPYDRPLTTMASFVMCEACAHEYHDPRNRRFHAQPNACPACGPRLGWRTRDEKRDSLTGEAALAAALDTLRSGGVVAVKGIGGFHLACDATRPEAVMALRTRKRRSDKPFAILARDVTEVCRFAEVSPDAGRLLTSPARPIVLLQRRGAPDIAVAREVAPGQATLGVMLPYSPLHHLLAAVGPLVLTSGNLSEEPIARDNAEALERLASLADGFLLHDREIHVVCDDSVIRVHQGRELPLRRSRGYAPYPVRLPAPAPAVLAVGGELKGTACLTRDRYAFLTPHIGDVGNLETLAALERACDHLARLFRVVPERLACDMHPGYLSAQWGRRLAAEQRLQVIEVQHHHAHLAALMGEHGLGARDAILAFAFDGTGYGTDGTIWGGEVLLGGYAGFERVAHLAPAPLPGGDAAVRRPARTALAQLWAAGLPWEGTHAAAALAAGERRVLRTQLERRINCVDTTSMGRFLDAAASLAGGRQSVSYEGQAAIEFEGMAREGAARGPAYHFECSDSPGDVIIFDGAPVLRGVAADAAVGRDRRDMARAVHVAVAGAIVAVASRLRETRGIDRVGLTGGVFQNVLLLALAEDGLRAAGFTVLLHHKVPPNDGGLALGQALVAAHA